MLEQRFQQRQPNQPSQFRGMDAEPPLLRTSTDDELRQNGDGLALDGIYVTWEELQHYGLMDAIKQMVASGNAKRWQQGFMVSEAGIRILNSQIGC